MQLPFAKNLGLLVLAVVGIASRANAGTVYPVPPGLAPGDTYRLVFVTHDTIAATSSDISTYNNFATIEADGNLALAALGVSWTAIASTESVNAVANIGGIASSAGIYLVNGTEVAASTAALFNTSVTNLKEPIDLDQYGDIINNAVWTGTDPSGQSDPTWALGSTVPFNGNASVFGDPMTGTAWLYQSLLTQPNLLPLNAISPVLTVPASTPEPASISLTVLGGAVLLLAYRRKQRNHRAAGRGSAPPALC